MMSLYEILSVVIPEQFVTVPYAHYALTVCLPSDNLALTCLNMPLQCQPGFRGHGRGHDPIPFMSRPLLVLVLLIGPGREPPRCPASYGVAIVLSENFLSAGGVLRLRIMNVSDMAV